RVRASRLLCVLALVDGRSHIRLFSLDACGVHSPDRADSMVSTRHPRVIQADLVAQIQVPQRDRSEISQGVVGAQCITFVKRPPVMV
ncbi:hypothetical protein C8R44DRAFT_807138, partial [Mycena epipterygia]